MYHHAWYQNQYSYPPPFFTAFLNALNIKNINPGQHTPHKLYSHMTPQTYRIWLNQGSLYFWPLDRQILILDHYLNSNLMSRQTLNGVWLDFTSIGCYTSFNQGEMYFHTSNIRLHFQSKPGIITQRRYLLSV